MFFAVAREAVAPDRGRQRNDDPEEDAQKHALDGVSVLVDAGVVPPGFFVLRVHEDKHAERKSAEILRFDIDDKRVAEALGGIAQELADEKGDRAEKVDGKSPCELGKVKPEALRAFGSDGFRFPVLVRILSLVCHIATSFFSVRPEPPDDPPDAPRPLVFIYYIAFSRATQEKNDNLNKKTSRRVSRPIFFAAPPCPKKKTGGRNSLLYIGSRLLCRRDKGHNLTCNIMMMVNFR